MPGPSKAIYRIGFEEARKGRIGPALSYIEDGADDSYMGIGSAIVRKVIIPSPYLSQKLAGATMRWTPTA